MAIDWTKPIQHHSGTEAILLPDRDGEDNVAVAFRVDCSQGWVLWNIPKQDAEQYFHNVPKPTTATEQTQPEIDWAGEVQYRLPSRDEWQDIQIVGGPVNECVWVCCDNDIPKTLLIGAVYWRNKPAEPKRVKGFVNIYHDYVYQTRTEACRAASDFRIACIEIDLHEGEGLEEVK